MWNELAGQGAYSIFTGFSLGVSSSKGRRIKAGEPEYDNEMII